MKKKIISMTFLLSILFSTCMVAFAEDDNTPYAETAAKLKSSGAIIYQNGTDSVVIDSNDLYILADTLDQFKYSIYSQMAEMNTYLTTEDMGIDLTTSNDIRVAHSAPEDIVDPLSINFETLVEGMAASQSIPHTPFEYGYEEDVKLYKTTAGLLTTDASDGIEMIEIEGSTADNLSAGAAAWVDGELILGTGADNKAFYDQGYINGFNEAMAGVNISYVYHKHQGNPNEVGGCYANVNKTCTTSLTVLSYVRTDQVWSEAAGKYLNFRFYNLKCPVCGYTATDWLTNAEEAAGYALRLHNVKSIQPVCGKTESTIESATIQFD